MADLLARSNADGGLDIYMEDIETPPPAENIREGL